MAITIDKNIAFGRPIIDKTSVPTKNVYDRFLAGESVNDLADDFKLLERQIEEAIRYELFVKTPD